MRTEEEILSLIEELENKKEKIKKEMIETPFYDKEKGNRKLLEYGDQRNALKWVLGNPLE